MSLQLYSVRALISVDLPRTLGAVAEMGFRQVEPYDFVARADEYRAALTEHGLTAPSAHARLSTVPDLTPTFEAAASLGVGVVIEPTVPVDRWRSVEDVRHTAERLNALVEPARTFGLKVGYHNHDWEFRPLGDVLAYDVFTDVLHPDVVLEVDTYWSTTAGIRTAALLRELGPRVGFLHLKDGPLGWDLKAQVPLGSGSLPLDDILQASPHAVRIVEFDDCAGDVMVAIGHSLRELRGRGVQP